MRRVAVVGSGISGLSAAWHLATRSPGGAPSGTSSGMPPNSAPSHVTLFEADAYFGGHTHTVDVCLSDRHGRAVSHGVDTGFLVYNERTYPGLIGLFERLGVPTVASDMSFSVQARSDGLEWSGSSLTSVFAQRRNLARPGFWRMLAQLLRFNRLATRLAQGGSAAALQQSIGDFLDENGFTREFRDWYFLPMIACIWSCPTEQMLAFPIATMIRFCHNHGLLQVSDRPQWRTVKGGARTYVQRLLRDVPDARLNTPVRGLQRHDDSVDVLTAQGAERFDAVVLACHADQALRILGEGATRAEQELLGAFRFQPNRAVLHTDAGQLPQRRQAWAAWNYEHVGQAAARHGPGAAQPAEGAAVCLHYLLNKLQPLPFAQPVVVSLNPLREPHADQVLAEFDYAHPVFDRAAIAAQAQLPTLQGQCRTWYCGAWMGYGFHEDGFKAGLAVAQALLARAEGVLA